MKIKFMSSSSPSKNRFMFNRKKLTLTASSFGFKSNELSDASIVLIRHDNKRKVLNQCCQPYVLPTINSPFSASLIAPQIEGLPRPVTQPKLGLNRCRAAFPSSRLHDHLACPTGAYTCLPFCVRGRPMSWSWPTGSASAKCNCTWPLRQRPN